MTIVEIKQKLDEMSVGSKAHFYRYMVYLGMFKDEKTALNVFHDYLNRTPNAASFIKRQQISYAFEEWRYRYGGACIKVLSKMDVIEKYNDKFRKVFEELEKLQKLQKLKEELDGCL